MTESDSFMCSFTSVNVCELSRVNWASTSANILQRDSSLGTRSSHSTGSSGFNERACSLLLLSVLYASIHDSDDNELASSILHAWQEGPYIKKVPIVFYSNCHFWLKEVQSSSNQCVWMDAYSPLDVIMVERSFLNIFFH